MSAALPEVSGSFGQKPTLTFPDASASGELEVLVLSRGDGALVEAGDELEVHYLGQAWQGGIFDNSYDRGATTSFPIGVGAVIGGWDESPRRPAGRVARARSRSRRTWATATAACRRPASRVATRSSSWSTSSAPATDLSRDGPLCFGGGARRYPRPVAGDEVTIGEFARRSGLSLKALRLYDARGLLEPVRVDPASGYRYYDLGAAGPGAHDLAAAAPGDAARHDRRRAGRAAGAGGRDPVLVGTIAGATWRTAGPELDLVLQSLGDPGTSAHPGHFGVDDVVVQPVGARTVATVRRHVTQEDLVATFASDALEIRALLDAGGASYGTEFWVLFHGAVGHDGDGPIETCIPYEGAVAPAGSVVLRQEPAHTLAYVPVTAADCRYPQIIGAYVALETWFSAGGRRPAGPPREIYPVPWSDEGVVAHVAQPVA